MKTCEEYVIERLESLEEELDELTFEYDELAFEYKELRQNYTRLLGMIKLASSGLQYEKFELDVYKNIGDIEEYNFIAALKKAEADNDSESEAETSEA